MFQKIIKQNNQVTILTRENIEFYTQRRKQYSEDFLKLTNQFQPKLNLLQKKLIASKQLMDGASQKAKSHKTKKVSKVLASLSKSNDIQIKIDKEMLRCSCQYQLDEVPSCNFNYSQTCSKIQHAMAPLIQNLHDQMQEKYEEIMADKEASDLYLKKDELQKMKNKFKRLKQILEKLQIMEMKQGEKSIKKLEKLDQLLPTDEKLPNSNKNMMSKRRLESILQAEEERRQRKQFENERIRENIEEQKQKYHSLDLKIKCQFRKLGLLGKKQESLTDFKDYVSNCQTNSAVQKNEQPSLFKKRIIKSTMNGDKRTSITIFSTQMNSQNVSPVAADITGRAAPIISNVNTQRTILNNFERTTQQSFNKIKKRYNKLGQRLEQGSNFNFQDNKLILL